MPGKRDGVLRCAPSILVCAMGLLLASWCPAEVPQRYEIVLGEQEPYVEPGTRSRPFPLSVTLSTDGRMLAVVAGGVDRRSDRSGQWLEVLQTTAGQLIHDLGGSDATAPRWHPTRPVLVMASDWGAGYPEYVMADVRSRKRREIIRGDAHAFCWAPAGMAWVWGIGILDTRKMDVVRGGNFGHRIPWDGGRYIYIRQMSCGTKSQVAVQFDGPGAPRLETFRKVPKHMKWVRAGRIDAEVREKQVIWYPRNPCFLRDGRLVYLRIYPGEWTHSWHNGDQVPEAETARNRAELWVCSLDGKNHHRVLTLWDLRPWMESPSADWVTVDSAGKIICYISWDKIRVIRLDKPL